MTDSKEYIIKIRNLHQKLLNKRKELEYIYITTEDSGISNTTLTEVEKINDKINKVEICINLVLKKVTDSKMVSMMNIYENYIESLEKL